MADGPLPPPIDFEPDYLAWRAQQMALYDRDYAAWRQSQADRHDQDYRSWRLSRASAPPTETAAWTSSGSTEAPDVPLPPTAGRMAEQYPDLWAAFQMLGEKASAAGPLDARARRLVHLGVALTAGSEGAVHSHTRRALAEGVGEAELEHVALLAVTTIGWPQAMKGLGWIRDIIGVHRSGAQRP